MGGFNGGTPTAFKQLVDTIAHNTDIDEKNGVMAQWHDESHLNRYLYDKNPLILTPMYGYPENRGGSGATHKEFHKTHKLLIMDKSNPKWGGHKYLRGQTEQKINTPKKTQQKSDKKMNASKKTKKEQVKSDKKKTPSTKSQTFTKKTADKKIKIKKRD